MFTNNKKNRHRDLKQWITDYLTTGSPYLQSWVYLHLHFNGIFFLKKAASKCEGKVVN